MASVASVRKPPPCELAKGGKTIARPRRPSIARNKNTRLPTAARVQSARTFYHPSLRPSDDDPSLSGFGSHQTVGTPGAAPCSSAGRTRPRPQCRLRQAWSAVTRSRSSVLNKSQSFRGRVARDVSFFQSAPCLSPGTPAAGADPRCRGPLRLLEKRTYRPSGDKATSCISESYPSGSNRFGEST